MEWNQLNPYVRFMDRRLCPVSYKTPVIAYDCRLFFVLDGTCRICVQGDTMTRNKSSCVFIPPGVPYQMFFEQDHPATLIVINLDLECTNSGQLSIAPRPPQSFEWEKMIPMPEWTPFDKPFCIDGASALEKPLLALLSEHDKGGTYCDEMCSALLKRVLVELLRLREGSGEAPDGLVRTVMEYLENHQAEEVTGEMLSARFHYHSYYLGKRFREATGVSIHKYLLGIRMKTCAELLAETTLSISEIAGRVGFSSASYLSEYFRKIYGQTPTAYRESARIV